MPTTALITLTTSPSSTPPEHTINSLLKALTPFKQTTPFTIGTKTPSQNIYQITSSWPTSTPTTLRSSPSFLAFKSAIESAIPLSSDPETLFTSLDTHSSNGDQAFDFTTPPLIEWVITSFPASSATESFKASIEADFARFEESYRAREEGRIAK
ncbi:hypothetical protein E8E13_010202 [Curvularia kusanoi]|uniref:Uncharacterized protein n=1 Tax=Curvularia kusanoi TaxID=90978 RepID=A0A9P4WBZ8_CURKU|nr:hypothetical protein E8E13_010202 [Curvularia kusanoi]